MKEKEISFEQAMARLEEITEKLEAGDAPLEEAMKLYAEGTKLAADCDKKLKKAEQAVETAAPPDGQ